jgi:hypothetical protein
VTKQETSDKNIPAILLIFLGEKTLNKKGFLGLQFLTTLRYSNFYFLFFLFTPPP